MTDRGHWPLVGRDAEMASLEAVAGQVLTGGRPRVVQIEGPAGIGKSALLSAWRRRDDRFRVLRARCHQLERESAFAAVRQLFQPVVGSAGEGAGAGDGGASAPQVLDAAAPSDPAAYGPDAMAAALDGLDGLAQRLAARQPLLLVVDELQWIDPSSLRWLVRLVRHVQPCRVLVAVITPTAEFRRPDPLLAELLHPSHCHTIGLGPLGVVDVRRLAQMVWEGTDPDPSFCAACHASTGGHPMFLHALLYHAQLSGLRPTAECQDRIRTVSLPTLRREIRHRLSQGAPEAVELAQAVALLGDGRPRSLLAAYCGRGEAVVRAVAWDLRGTGLLRADGELGFVHPVVRDTVLETMCPDELSRGHARAAQVSYFGGRPDEEVAEHLLAADPVQGAWAVPVLRGAAREALRRGAPERAAGYLRCALRQPPQTGERGPVLLQLAAVTSCYNADHAGSYVSGALESLTNDTDRRAALGLLTSLLLLAPGSGTALAAVDRLMMDGMQADGRGAESELALSVAMLQSLLEGERPTDRPATPAVDVDQLLGRTPGERQLLALHAFRALRAGRPASYVGTLLDRAAGTLPVLSHETFPLHCFVALTLLHLDELDRADRWRSQLAQGIEGRGRDLLAGAMAAYQAASALRRGDVTEALAMARQALRPARAAGRVPYATTLDAIRIDALLAQGDIDAAERVALARSGEGPGKGAWEPPLFLMSSAALRTAQGDARAALSLLHECGHHLDASGTVNPAVCPWRSRAAALHLALGEADAARELVEEELDLARQCRIPRAIGVALRMAGKAATGARRLALLDEAVEVLTPTPARLELSRALHDLGVASMHRGDTAGARSALRKGLVLATECGATVLATRLRQRLHDAGGRAGRDETGLLTPGEERVSTLAAQGHSNKEIAERLFVSLRTVEARLTGAYRKLGISRRSQLAAAMASFAPGRGERTTHG
ncbi:ATP-binding protein [Streptomyces sp. NPDC127097]|uniref:ATP-binding protein n=1 Tax=Streptomyces sp. NPDC127097 TaxID=3347136 RepID=UPI00365C28F7